MPDLSLVAREIERRAEQLIADRREVHRHAELAFQEHWTSAYVADRLRGLGYAVRTGVGRTGVVATLDGSGPGRYLLLRADMDALPVVEKTGLPFASEHQGTSHACGHDGHVATLLGVADLLAALRQQWPGKVMVVFQPAEETLEGAQAMLEDGLFAQGRPEAALGYHLWNFMPLGHVGVRAGATHASVDEVQVVIEGLGGHGGMPHLGVDAIAMAAQAITALQTLVSREISPMEPAVLTFGSIRGGTAYNVLADRVEMSGTARAFSPHVRRQIRERAEALLAGVVGAMRGRATFRVRPGTPPLVSEPAMSALVRRVAEATVGAEKVVETQPVMGGEDMAYIMAEVPGCYFVVGSQASEGEPHPLHHHPAFNFEESALAIAARVMTGSALTYLEAGL